MPQKPFHWAFEMNITEPLSIKSFHMLVLIHGRTTPMTWYLPPQQMNDGKSARLSQFQAHLLNNAVASFIFQVCYEADLQSSRT